MKGNLRTCSRCTTYFFLVCLLAVAVGCGGGGGDSPSVESREADSAGATRQNAGKQQPKRAAEEEENSFKNAPPKIDSLTLTPTALLPGTKVTAEVTAFDEDDDEVFLSYRWLVNDVPLPDEEGAELLTEGFKKGDRITLFVTPSDEGGSGTAKAVSLEIMNSTPEITSSFPISGLSGSTLIYDVVATDPDGDELTFFLDMGAPGMKIDQSTGRFSWELPAGGLKEKVQIKIRATDGDASAIQNVTITPP